MGSKDRISFKDHLKNQHECLTALAPREA